MYVILTSKPGQFRTEIVDGIVPVETYDYLFYGTKKAEFVIAELGEDARLRIVDETGPAALSPAVSDVPARLLEKFDTVDRAVRELRHLTAFGTMQTELCKR